MLGRFFRPLMRALSFRALAVPRLAPGALADESADVWAVISSARVMQADPVANPEFMWSPSLVQRT